MTGSAAPFAGGAERAARDWLARVDEGNAAESWGLSSSLFRRAVSSDDWARTIEAVRVPLGRVVERTLHDAQPATELPGAPDGEYVVFEFETHFAHMPAAIETVTPMREADGSWRVSGYFIR